MTNARTLAKIRRIALNAVNILGCNPEIMFTDEEIQFRYPLSRVAGNAVDGDSLYNMRLKLEAELGRKLGTLWVGIYGNEFRIWAVWA